VETTGNLPELTAIRDSKRPEAGAPVMDQAVFAAFVAAVRRGRYDLRCSAARRDGSVSSSEMHDATLRTSATPYRTNQPRSGTSGAQRHIVTMHVRCVM
jgi:Domain of unknown function (DUF397)